MLVIFDQRTRTWRCRLPDEPGNPVIIAETLEEVLGLLLFVAERRRQCDSDENQSQPTFRGT